MSAKGAAAAQPQQTFLGKLASELKSSAASLFSAITNVVTHKAWPFVETLFQKIEMDNVAVLAPLGEEALADFEKGLEGQNLSDLLTNPEGWLKVFNGVVAGLFQKAESLVETVTKHDIITAAHAVVTNAEEALANANKTGA